MVAETSKWMKLPRKSKRCKTQGQSLEKSLQWVERKNDASKGKVEGSCGAQEDGRKKAAFKICPYSINTNRSLSVHSVPGIMTWHIYMIDPPLSAYPSVVFWTWFLCLNHLSFMFAKFFLKSLFGFAPIFQTYMIWNIQNPYISHHSSLP